MRLEYAPLQKENMEISVLPMTVFHYHKPGAYPRGSWSSNIATDGKTSSTLIMSKLKLLSLLNFLQNSIGQFQITLSSKWTHSLSWGCMSQLTTPGRLSKNQCCFNSGITKKPCCSFSTASVGDCSPSVEWF